MAKDLFNRYIWLVDTIYRAGKITLDEINRRWVQTDMSGGERIPDRTFHNHRIAIEEMFDINIECDRHNGYVYYIQNAGDLERGTIRNWLLDTFTVNNLINESQSIRDRILLEDIPSGRKFLTPILKAMQRNVILFLKYQSFQKEKPHSFQINPYCVKVFRQRWYVVAYCTAYKQVRVYALDRILDLRVTDETFDYPKDFNPQTYFKYSFGIIVDETIPVETIRLQVFNEKVKYLRALPLHASQKEIKMEQSYSIFEYTLRPTYDFIQELLSNASQMEVVAPDWLRERMKDTLKQMRKRYKKEK